MGEPRALRPIAPIAPGGRGLGEGAAQEAPTSPHATPRTTPGRATGPERFWARWPMRVAFGVGLVISSAAHCSIMPLQGMAAVPVSDYEGEAAIPIDILEPGSQSASEPEPAPALAPPGPAPASEGKDKTAVARDAGTAPAEDAADAGGAPRDSALVPPVDAAASEAKAPDASDGIAVDAGEGGPPAPPAPDSLLASSGAIQADVVFVTVVINAIEIRKNPGSTALGEILRSIPEWDDFMHGTEGLIDPVGDTDWILISGPSLRDSSADAVTLHYRIADATVEKAIQVVSHHDGRGGPYDAGVPGVKAWLAHADRAERALVRPRPHVLVIVPPRRAAAVAKQLVRAKALPTNIMPGVATYVRVVDPHHALPSLIPEGILEMRLRITSRDDGGAEFAVDGDCKDEATAGRDADALARAIRQNNTFAISLGTHGLLNRPDVSAEGKQVHVRVTATREQIDATLASVQLVLSGLGSAPENAPRREDGR